MIEIIKKLKERDVSISEINEFFELIADLGGFSWGTSSDEIDLQWNDDTHWYQITEHGVKKEVLAEHSKWLPKSERERLENELIEMDTNCCIDEPTDFVENAVRNGISGLKYFCDDTLVEEWETYKGEKYDFRSVPEYHQAQKLEEERRGMDTSSPRWKENCAEWEEIVGKRGE